MRVGLTYDLRDDYLAEGYGEEETAEFDRLSTIDSIDGALRRMGFETDRIGHVRRLTERLAQGDRWDLVFNIAEGLRGVAREAQVPALLEAYNIPYVFSDPLTLALSLDKGMTKRVIRDLGVPTPGFCVVERESDVENIDLPYPLFAKPVAEGTGKGVTPASKIQSPEELRARCKALLEQFHQPVLVEAFLPGREFTVGIVGTGRDARSVGVLEIVLNPEAEQDVYSYVNKEKCEELVKYVRVEGPIAEEAIAVSLAAWRGLGCRDGGRVDVRADAAGRLQFMEVNPLAGLHPEHSDLPMAAAAEGVSYQRLMTWIVESAIKRHGLKMPKPDGRTGRAGDAPPASPRARIAVLHQAIPADAPEDERDTLLAAEAVSDTLADLGHEPARAVFSLDVKESIERLRAIEPDAVFNLVESVEGQGRLIYLAPAVLDYLGLPYTGSNTEAMYVTSNKILAKRIMRRAGLPTAPWVALDKAEGEGELPGRHIIKAVWEHASVGMEESGIVEGLGLEDLRRELERRSSRVKGGVFAEAFIDGREFNLSLLEGPDGPEVMPPAEIVFKDYPPEKWRVVDYKAKWVTGSFEYTHTPRSFRFGKKDQPLLEELRRLALECWRLFGLGGYARVDFRVDAEGRSWVLEINANPCLTPDCGFSAAAKQGGFDYKATIERIAQAALRGTRVEARL